MIIKKCNEDKVYSKKEITKIYNNNYNKVNDKIGVNSVREK